MDYNEGMVGFTKLFSTIIHSTIWRQDMHIKVVWITMLAMADRNGRVWASVPGLADAARVTLEQCEDALRVLLSPDAWSRTKDNEGRRISEIDGGWQICNYAKYRAARDQDARRLQVREAVRRHRAVNKDVINVSHVSQGKPMQKQIADSRVTTKRLAHPSAERDYSDDFLAFWHDYPRKVGKETAWGAWKKTKAKRPEIDRVLSALKAMKNSEGWKKDGGKFIPYPATWINRGGWDDEPNQSGPRIGRGGMIMPTEDD